MESTDYRFDEIEEQQMNSSSTTTRALPLLSLNHVSYVCKSVSDSVKFYQNVLGFLLIQRPSSFNFQGAWLFNYGVGIHLLQSDNLPRKKRAINPKDNHISFQSSNMKLVIEKLEEMGFEYVTAQVEEGGIKVDQLFFHDPDGYMIEICNCGNLPVIPLPDASCPLKSPKKLDCTAIDIDHQLDSPDDFYGSSEVHCSSKVEAQMMESLMTDMMNMAY